MSTESSSSSETTVVFNITDPKTTLISLNMSNITKLTPTNFITWRLQISALLEAHELHCFISDDDQSPPETLTTAEGQHQPNPNFAAWKRQDKLFYSAIFGTLTVAVQPIVARAKNSREIWEILFRTYGKPSRGHIKQLKQQLKNNSKGNKSINEYIRGIIEKAYQLALLGSPLEHEDLLDYITEGLGEDYRAIVEMVNGRDVPITTDELHEKLINRENSLKLTGSNDVNTPVTANPTNVRPQQSNSHNSSRRCPQYQQQQTQMNRGMQQYATPRGHPQYTSPWLAPHLPLPTPHWQQQAHHVTMSSPDLSPWLLDSGASHHIASDFNNLSLHTPYNGNDNVMIGNGAGLPITHTGSVSLPSKSRKLRLHNVLCVPDMKKNLISVNKLCKTNNVMVQLCPSNFQVKDLHTGTTLLKGKANEGVYEWPSSSSPLAFVSNKSSPAQWHSRLGHPNSQTLHLCYLGFLYLCRLLYLLLRFCFAILVQLIKVTNSRFLLPV